MLHTSNLDQPMTNQWKDVISDQLLPFCYLFSSLSRSVNSVLGHSEQDEFSTYLDDQIAIAYNLDSFIVGSNEYLYDPYQARKDLP